jgi:dTDP-4-dehydrorhamnose 3,5-epimerase-like enzyme
LTGKSVNQILFSWNASNKSFIRLAYLLDLKTFTDIRGNLTVIEKTIPFGIKRIFYIYGVDDSVRGGHRHHKTIQAAICLKGNCKVWCNNGISNEEYVLDKPYKCLILEPEDWHKMYSFSEDAILMVLASEYFNPEDYIYKPYD